MGFPKYAEDIQKAVDNCRHFADLDGFTKDDRISGAGNDKLAFDFYAEREQSFAEMQTKAKEYANILSELLDWLTNPELSVVNDLALQLQSKNVELNRLSSQKSYVEQDNIKLQNVLKMTVEKATSLNEKIAELDKNLRLREAEIENLNEQIRLMKMKSQNHELMKELGVRRV